MKKKVLITMTTAILIIGAVSTVYAKEAGNANKYGFGRGMMYQNNYNYSSDMMNKNRINIGSNYENMIDLMRENGFEAGARAMESKDFNAMNSFMGSLTEDQYNKMIDIMKNNGYEAMARMISSISRKDMINMHNSMMGR